MRRAISLPPELNYAEGEEVMIEPLPDHPPDEIVRLFEQAGAPVPERLAPRSFSGKAPPHLREALRSIATIHRKPIKKVH